MIKLEAKPKRNIDVVWKHFRESILLDSGHAINEAGASIWEMCDGKTAVSAIIAKIVENYDCTQETARKDVLLFLKTLEETKLISFE